MDDQQQSQTSIVKFKKKFLKGNFILIGGIIVLLSGCVGTGNKTTQQKQINVNNIRINKEEVQKTAEEYLKASTEGRYKDAYKFISPKDKELISEEQYVNKLKNEDNTLSSISISKKITNVTLDNNSAIVSVIEGTNLLSINKDYKFEFIDDNWYRVFEPDQYVYYEIPLSKINNVKEEKIGGIVSLPALEFKVNGAKLEKTITSEFGSRKTATGKYLIIDSTVYNNGKSKFNFNPDDYLSVRDSQDRTFKSSNDFAFDNTLYYEEINPGLDKTGNIIYEVPENASGFILVITDGKEIYKIGLDL